MADDLNWKLLSSEQVRKDEWIDFRAGRYELPNGRVIDPFYTYRKCNFTVIVAKTPEGDYLCVKQYRPGVEKVLTEFPAGAVEPGEDPEKAAKRELMEETGYESEDWTRLCKISPNATIADNMAYCYLARDCRKKGSRHLDDTECVDMLVLSEKELKRMISRDEFIQAVHVAAYYMAKEKEEK